MPIEARPDGSISITGADGMELYRRITLYHALRLQVMTGGRMRATRISAVACAKRLGYAGRTAAALLADMERKHPELIGDADLWYSRGRESVSTSGNED